MEPIELRPEWQVRRRYQIDLVTVLCVVSFAFALLGGFVTYQIIKPRGVSGQRLVDLSHAVYKACEEEFAPNGKNPQKTINGSAKCDRIADVVLGEMP